MPAAWGLTFCQAPPGSAHEAAACAGAAAMAPHAPARTAATAARTRIGTPPLWRRLAPYSTLILAAGLEVRRGVQGVEAQQAPEQRLGPRRQRRLKLQGRAQRTRHEHLVARALHGVR